MLDEAAIPGLGGDAGAGGGDGGGTAVAEPEVQPGGEGGAPPPDGGQPAEGGEPTPEGGEPKPPETPEDTDPEAGLHEDSRIVDVKTRQQIAELRKTNPALAKVASDAIFGRQAVMKEFPEAKSIGDVLKSVRSQRATLEAVGGEEGITKLNDEVTDYRKEIEQFGNGDPELAQALFEANPGGFVRTVDSSLQLLLERDGAAGGRFDQVLAGPFNQRLTDAGLPKTIATLIDHVKAGDGEAAYALLQKVDAWMKNVDAYAKEIGKGKAAAPDPKEQALSAREQKITQAETASYEAAIGTDVNKLNNSALQPLLDGVFKQLPELKAEGKQRFTHAVQSEVWKTMQGDKVFQRNARAVMAKKDPAASAKFINAKFQELLGGPDGIFIKVRNEMYPNLGRAAKKPAVVPAKPAVNGNQPAKVAYAGGRPKFQDVSWESEGGKTTDIDWIRGIAYLKDGKQVKFDPNSPPNRL
jgi:hypothetical protein